jgi:4-alpha-glucanotransferase
MYVGQFAVDPSADPPIARPSRRRVASLGTHDTATFSGFWTGADVDELASVGAIDEDEAARLRRARVRQRSALAATLLGRRGGDDPGTTAAVQHAVLRAWLARLAGGPAELVLVTLEDLWLEPDPQNVPGTTGTTHRNWSRRLARATDALDADPGVQAVLGALRERRSVATC